MEASYCYFQNICCKNKLLISFKIDLQLTMINFLKITNSLTHYLQATPLRIKLPLSTLIMKLNFNVANQKYSSAYGVSDGILKEYFTKRMTLTPDEQLSYLTNLSVCKFNLEDTRWLSLTLGIEKNLSKYNNASKVTIFRSLGKSRFLGPLYTSLLQYFQQHIQELSFDDLAYIIWTISKVSPNVNRNLIHQIFSRMFSLVNPTLDQNISTSPIYNSRSKEDKSYRYSHEDEAELNHKQFQDEGEGEELGKSKDRLEIILTNDFHPQVQPNCIYIRPNSIVLTLTAMAEMKTVDLFLLKILLKRGVEENLNKFLITGLTVILMSLKNLHMTNKRIYFRVYKKIRQNYKMLEQEKIPQDNLFHLITSVSHVVTRPPSDAQHKAMCQSEVNELEWRKEKQDSRQFMLWLVETLLIRSSKKRIYPKTAALILQSLAKAEAYQEKIYLQLLEQITKNIMDSTTPDITMTLFSLCNLPKDLRAKFKQSEDIVFKRMTDIYLSLKGKSLYSIYFLSQGQKIQLPSHIQKYIVQNYQEIQNFRIQKEKSRNQNKKQPENNQQTNQQPTQKATQQTTREGQKPLFKKYKNDSNFLKGREDFKTESYKAGFKNDSYRNKDKKPKTKNEND